MSIQSKIESLKATKPGVQEAVDDLVCDMAARVASRTNNEGLKAQLEFLEQNGMSEEDVLSYLEEATDG